MELMQRKEKILSAVVESYIATGEPIGSRALQDITGLTVSSATIRNELASLVDEGYLHQPHTSAGRVPTRKGYRYYIDNICKLEYPSDRLKERLERLINSVEQIPETILAKTARTLSELTDMAAVCTSPSSIDARVHKIRFVSTGRHTSMAVLVTSNGMVKSRLFRCEFVLTPEILSMFDKAINEKFSGVRLLDINVAFLQTVASSFGELTLFMPEVLAALLDAAKSAIKTSVTVSGETNLLFIDGYSLNCARNVLKFLSDSQSVTQLLDDIYPNKVSLSDENNRFELIGSSVITSRYTIMGENAGSIALIGPMRVDYKKLIGLVDYSALCVSNAIGQMLEN